MDCPDINIYKAVHSVANFFTGSLLTQKHRFLPPTPTSHLKIKNHPTGRVDSHFLIFLNSDLFTVSIVSNGITIACNFLIL